MVITDPEQADAAWLERALRRGGALRDGGVATVQLEPGRGRAWSRMTGIRVGYREGSTGPRPERLLLKLCGAEGGVFGPSEVWYYTRDYIGLPNSPVPRCFDAAYEESPRRYHLLLEDLSATHANCDDREPTASYGESLAGALATLHLHRWGAASLGKIGLEMPGAGDFSRYLAHVGAGLEPLIALTAGEIDPAWPGRLRTIFARLAERYAARAADPRGITQTHGDPNPGNILAPHAGDRPIYLIDRQPFDWSLTRWLGASDFIYAMVLYWDTTTRRRLEMPTLRHYHALLLAGGITDYTFDHLIRDYRLCIVEAIAAAVEWCVLAEDRQRMRWLWSLQLERGLAAYEDLKCAEIWE
jgi:hypothetical protein